MNNKKDIKTPKIEKKPSVTTPTAKVEPAKKATDKPEPTKKVTPSTNPSNTTKLTQSKSTASTLNNSKVETTKPATKPVTAPSPKPSPSTSQKTISQPASKLGVEPKLSQSGNLTSRDNKAKSTILPNNKAKPGLDSPRKELVKKKSEVGLVK